jgi:hypothetical protein
MRDFQAKYSLPDTPPSRASLNWPNDFGHFNRAL